VELVFINDFISPLKTDIGGEGGAKAKQMNSM